MSAPAAHSTDDLRPFCSVRSSDSGPPRRLGRPVPHGLGRSGRRWRRCEELSEAVACRVIEDQPIPVSARAGTHVGADRRRERILQSGGRRLVIGMRFGPRGATIRAARNLGLERAYGPARVGCAAHEDAASVVSGSVSNALPWPFVSAPASMSSIAWSGRSRRRTLCAISARLLPSRFASSVAVIFRSSSRSAMVRASSIGVRSSRTTFSISATSSESAPSSESLIVPGSPRVRPVARRASGARRRRSRIRPPALGGR
jgi:hypothetical protein